LGISATPAITVQNDPILVARRRKDEIIKHDPSINKYILKLQVDKKSAIS
jgi:hypothetical protein